MPRQPAARLRDSAAVDNGAPGLEDARRRGAVVDNNGFDPVWDETYTFDLLCPDMTIILFKVMDKDLTGTDFIGQVDLLPILFPLKSLDARNTPSC